MRHMMHFILTLTLLLVPFRVADAHPGRTDANGGHTCRTNCTERWGLQYGEYHYHNGGGSSSGAGARSTQSQPASQPKSPVVQKKTIVAVDQANVVAYPYSTEVTGTLWYGKEVNDFGSYDPSYILIDQGYLSKSVLTEYTVSKATSVQVAVDKAYFFSAPIATSKVRGNANKDAFVNVVGESNGFYYGSTVDANGKVLVGFVSKSVVKSPAS